VVTEVKSEDLVHPIEGNDQATIDGNRPTREARARSAGRYRNAVAISPSNELDDLGGALWPRDGVRLSIPCVERLVVQVGRVMGTLKGDEGEDLFKLAALRRLHEGDVTWREGGSRSP
jgi:hypothetical protein